MTASMPSRTPPQVGVRPRYGVVVLTMGQRPKELDQAICSVLAQRDVEVDVVVVGNGWEPEGLPDGVRSLGLQDNVGIPAGRNAGASLVHGDLLFFLDDDASAAPDWLARLLDVYRSQPHAMAVGGAPRPDYAAARPEWFPPDYDWVFGCHYLGLPNHREPVRHLIGANMSARLDPLLAVGGFHADNHDDMDLSHRLAHHHGPDAVVYEPKAEVHHHVSAQRLTWSYFWRRCFFVNRGKVGAFADMGEAGNLGAELRFGMRVLGNTGRGLVALLRGNRARFLQTQAAAAGLAFAVCGHVVGRIEHAFGRRTPVLTEGLRAQLVSAERSG